MSKAQTEESPNGLQLNGKPTVAKMGKWPLYVALLFLLLLGGVLVYSVNFAHDQEEAVEAKRHEVSEEEKPIWLVDGSGLALDPKKDQQSGVIAPPQKKQEPIVIVQHDQKAQERANEEANNIRRVRLQAYVSALGAPLIAKKENRDTVSESNGNSGSASGGGKNEISAMPVGNEVYDPAADRDKEQFFERAKKDNAYQLDAQRTAGMPLELKTGAVVPGVLLTGINSDLPGNMIAQVSQNVFDTATGRNLLIPQGTKIYGVYDSRVVFGQERCLIAWNRLIFPDGSSVNLGAMPGADMSGMAGFNDETNNHYLRIFGSAFMMSLVTGSMAYAMDSANQNVGSNSSRNGTSMQDEMTSALAQQLGQATTQLLQKNLNIKPTLEIRPGYQFNIVITKDIAFRQPYQAWR